VEPKNISDLSCSKETTDSLEYKSKPFRDDIHLGISLDNKFSFRSLLERDDTTFPNVKNSEHSVFVHDGCRCLGINGIGNKDCRGLSSHRSGAPKPSIVGESIRTLVC